MATKQSIIARALSTVSALTSIVKGTATALAAQRLAFQAEVENLRTQLAGREDVDLSGLDSVLSEAEAAEADYAKAVAVNTDASAEVHTDDGGTGDTHVDQGGTVETPEPDPVVTADDTTQQQGGDAVQQQGGGEDNGG